jgi:hypothetical protein
MIASAIKSFRISRFLPLAVSAGKEEHSPSLDSQGHDGGLVLNEPLLEKAPPAPIEGDCRKNQEKNTSSCGL